MIAPPTTKWILHKSNILSMCPAGLFHELVSHWIATPTHHSYITNPIECDICLIHQICTHDRSSETHKVSMLGACFLSPILWQHAAMSGGKNKIDVTLSNFGDSCSGAGVIPSSILWVSTFFVCIIMTNPFVCYCSRSSKKRRYQVDRQGSRVSSHWLRSV